MNGDGTIVSGVAGRYATALFELALEQKGLDKVAGELDDIGAMVEDSAALKRLVLSPSFSADQQVRALDAILDKAKITGLTANFVKLVTRNRRLFVLPDMVRDFRKLTAHHRGEASAEVVCAHELTAAQQKSLASALTSSLGKTVKLTTRVDPALLGGLVVKIGSRMIDTSLRTKLNSLRLAMKEVG